MTYLIVAAHPDDEILGAGGLIYTANKEGHKVYVAIMCGKVQARNKRPEDVDLQQDIEMAMKEIGVYQYVLGDFPNIKMNNSDHLEIVQFIETAIITSGADIVITHHPADLNNDHLHTSISCQEAVRLFQRRTDVHPIKEFLYMEVPSATDWGLNYSMNAFLPNTFMHIGEDGVKAKIKALSSYRAVMRDFPHPRSDEVIRGLAAVRGGQSNFCYAEAYQMVFRRV